MLDLLFNAKAVDTAMAEFVDIVNPAGQTLTLADLDQFMWNHHPRLASKGSYNRLSVSANPGGAWFTRTLVSADHEGQMDYLRTFMQPGGFGYDKLVAEVADSAIPDTPSVTFIGGAGFPLDDLRFQSSAFSDASGSFARMKWRIGEVSDPSAPNYNPLQVPPYEIEALWETESCELRGRRDGPPDHSPGRQHLPGAREAPRRHRALEPLVRPGRIHGWRRGYFHLPAESRHQRDHVSTPHRSRRLNLQPATRTTISNSSSCSTPGAYPWISDRSSFTDGIAAALVGTLAPGARVLLVRNQAAFELRHGTGLPVAGEYSGKLDNAGETITLSFGLSQVIRSFTYSDTLPWAEAADGDGPSLVLIAPDTNPDHTLAANWRPSVSAGGNPGTADIVSFVGDPHADDDGDGLVALLEYAVGSSDLVPGPSPVGSKFVAAGELRMSFSRNLAADDLVFEIQLSDDLVDWAPAGTAATLTGWLDTGGGIRHETWRILEASSTQRFVRLAIFQK